MRIRYQTHKAEYRAKSKRWYEENREYVRELERNRYLANRDAYIQKSRRWRRDNNARYRAYNLRWAEENPEKVEAVQKGRDTRRRARKRGLPNDFTVKDWEVCVAYWNGKCAVCGREPDEDVALAADHWIALSHPDCPGTVKTNMIPLCDGKGGCNTRKHARNAELWLTEVLGETAANEKLKEVETYFEYVKSLEQRGAS